MKNNFWKESLSMLDSFRRDYLKCNPEEIINSSIWESNVFKKNGRPLSKCEYSSLCNKITKPIDVIRPDRTGKCRFTTWDEISTLYNDIAFDEFISIRQLIRDSLTSQKVQLGMLEFTSPNRPILISLLSLSKKGCNKWIEIKRKLGTTAGILKKEEKWHDTMGRIQSIYFWEKCYRNVMQINFSNRLKWLQYQINRGTLKTNRIVCKFVDNVSSLCTFCNQDTETISHLFWNCRLVKNLISETYEYFQINYPIYFHDHDFKSFVFNSKGKILDGSNLSSLYLKLYVWKNRCRKIPLNLASFLIFFAKEIQILKRSNFGFLTTIEIA